MLLVALIVLPLVPAVLTAMFGWRPPVAWTHVATSVVVLILAISLGVRVLDETTVASANGALRADALAAFMVLVVSIVALLAIWSSVGYIDTELASGQTNAAGARLFGVLLPLFVAAMLLALLAGNAAVTWVAIEATTIATAFLVGHRRSRSSLEASWKYVIIGSVGIALAFLGTIVLAYAARAAGATNADALNWNALATIGSRLDPGAARLAGGLLLLGYGTKVGLAPMHTWLPDAHSQAPAPVSALMSGVLLAVAFSVILRFKVIIDAALGPGYMRGLLIAFSILSLVVAVARAGLNANLAWATAVVFVVMVVASGALMFQAQRLLLGAPANPAAPATAPRTTLMVPVVGALVALGLLGITLGPLQNLLDAAARVVGT